MTENNENSVITGIKNNKNAWLTGLVVVVVLALLIGGSAKKGEESTSKENTQAAAEQEGCKEGYLFSETTGKPCEAQNLSVSAIATTENLESKTTSRRTQQAASTNLSYDAARAAYAGRSVEIGTACALTPATQTVKAGTRILLDNASTETVTVTFQGKTVVLRPYHYATSQLKAVGTFPIACGDNATAGSIVVE